MALSKTPQLLGIHIKDAALIHFSIGDKFSFYQLTQPRCCTRIELVVVGSHFSLLLVCEAHTYFFLGFLVLVYGLLMAPPRARLVLGLSSR
jgi:hypothetical protein